MAASRDNLKFRLPHLSLQIVLGSLDNIHPEPEQPETKRSWFSFLNLNFLRGSGAKEKLTAMSIRDAIVDCLVKNEVLTGEDTKGYTANALALASFAAEKDEPKSIIKHLYDALTELSEKFLGESKMPLLCTKSKPEFFELVGITADSTDAAEQSAVEAFKLVRTLTVLRRFEVISRQVKLEQGAEERVKFFSNTGVWLNDDNTAELLEGVSSPVVKRLAIDMKLAADDRALVEADDYGQLLEGTDATLAKWCASPAMCLWTVNDDFFPSRTDRKENPRLNAQQVAVIAMFLNRELSSQRRELSHKMEVFRLYPAGIFNELPNEVVDHIVNKMDGAQASHAIYLPLEGVDSEDFAENGHVLPENYLGRFTGFLHKFIASVEAKGKGNENPVVALLNELVDTLEGYAAAFTGGTSVDDNAAFYSELSEKIKVSLTAIVSDRSSRKALIKLGKAYSSAFKANMAAHDNDINAALEAEKTNEFSEFRFLVVLNRLCDLLDQRGHAEIERLKIAADAAVAAAEATDTAESVVNQKKAKKKKTKKAKQRAKGKEEVEAVPELAEEEGAQNKVKSRKKPAKKKKAKAKRHSVKASKVAEALKESVAREKEKDAELKAATENFTELSDKTKEVVEALKESTIREQEKEAELAAVKAQFTALSNQLNIVRGELDSQKGNVSKLTAELEAAHSEAQQLTSEITELRSSVDNSSLAPIVNTFVNTGLRCLVANVDNSDDTDVISLAKLTTTGNVTADETIISSIERLVKHLVHRAKEDSVSGHIYYVSAETGQRDEESFTVPTLDLAVTLEAVYKMGDHGSLVHQGIKKGLEDLIDTASQSLDGMLGSAEMVVSEIPDFIPRLIAAKRFDFTIGFKNAITDLESKIELVEKSANDLQEAQAAAEKTNQVLLDCVAGDYDQVSLTAAIEAHQEAVTQLSSLELSSVPEQFATTVDTAIRSSVAALCAENAAFLAANTTEGATEIAQPRKGNYQQRCEAIDAHTDDTTQLVAQMQAANAEIYQFLSTNLKKAFADQVKATLSDKSFTSRNHAANVEAFSRHIMQLQTQLQQPEDSDFAEIFIVACDDALFKAAEKIENEYRELVSVIITGKEKKTVPARKENPFFDELSTALTKANHAKLYEMMGKTGNAIDRYNSKIQREEAIASLEERRDAVIQQYTQRFSLASVKQGKADYEAHRETEATVSSLSADAEAVSEFDATTFMQPVHDTVSNIVATLTEEAQRLEVLHVNAQGENERTRPYFSLALALSELGADDVVEQLKQQRESNDAAIVEIQQAKQQQQEQQYYTAVFTQLTSIVLEAKLAEGADKITLRSSKMLGELTGVVALMNVVEELLKILGGLASTLGITSHEDDINRLFAQGQSVLLEIEEVYVRASVASPSEDLLRDRTFPTRCALIETKIADWDYNNLMEENDRIIKQAQDIATFKLAQKTTVRALGELVVDGDLVFTSGRLATIFDAFDHQVAAYKLSFDLDGDAIDDNITTATDALTAELGLFDQAVREEEQALQTSFAERSDELVAKMAQLQRFGFDYSNLMEQTDAVLRTHHQQQEIEKYLIACQTAMSNELVLDSITEDATVVKRAIQRFNDAIVAYVGEDFEIQDAKYTVTDDSKLSFLQPCLAAFAKGLNTGLERIQALVGDYPDDLKDGDRIIDIDDIPAAFKTLYADVTISEFTSNSGASLVRLAGVRDMYAALCSSLSAPAENQAASDLPVRALVLANTESLNTLGAAITSMSQNISELLRAFSVNRASVSFTKEKYHELSVEQLLETIQTYVRVPKFRDKVLTQLIEDIKGYVNNVIETLLTTSDFSEPVLAIFLGMNKQDKQEAMSRVRKLIEFIPVLVTGLSAAVAGDFEGQGDSLLSHFDTVLAETQIRLIKAYDLKRKQLTETISGEVSDEGAEARINVYKSVLIIWGGRYEKCVERLFTLIPQGTYATQSNVDEVFLELSQSNIELLHMFELVSEARETALEMRRKLWVLGVTIEGMPTEIAKTIVRGSSLTAKMAVKRIRDLEKFAKSAQKTKPIAGLYSSIEAKIAELGVTVDPLPEDAEVTLADLRAIMKQLVHLQVQAAKTDLPMTLDSASAADAAGSTSDTVAAASSAAGASTEASASDLNDGSSSGEYVIGEEEKPGDQIPVFGW